jgi:hypothetical protein
MQLYPGGQATPLAIHWETDERSDVFIMGRQAFSAERLDVPLVTFVEHDARIHDRDNWPAGIRRLGE